MFDAGPAPDTTPLLQDPAFAAALRLCGQGPVVLPSGLMVLQRRFMGVQIAMLPRATPPDDLQEQLYVRNLHRLPLIMSPETACAAPRALRLRAPQYMICWDIDQDTELARAGLDQKWRNQLKRAEASGLRIADRTMPASLDHPLLKFEAAQSRKRRYANWPNALTAAFAHVAPEQTRLFVAYLRGTPVAHMLFLRHGSRATYHIGHITDAGKTHCAHNLLLWRASRWLRQHGHQKLDLGMIDQRTPGLNRFKLRTGARKVRTGGTWIRWHPLARGPRP